MNEVMINNWNNTVTSDDIVYHIGDFSLGTPRVTYEILKELQGRIYLIKGNHEKSIMSSSLCRKRFEDIYDYKEIEVNGRLVVMCHYPIETWKNRRRGAIHLHGHVHRIDEEPINTIKNRFNVNVEHIGYTPKTLQELINENRRPTETSSLDEN